MQPDDKPLIDLCQKASMAGWKVEWGKKGSELTSRERVCDTMCECDNIWPR